MNVALLSLLLSFRDIDSFLFPKSNPIKSQTFIVLLDVYRNLLYEIGISHIFYDISY